VVVEVVAEAVPMAPFVTSSNKTVQMDTSAPSKTSLSVLLDAAHLTTTQIKWVTIAAS
jgi:hypothetical protein